MGISSALLAGIGSLASSLPARSPAVESTTALSPVAFSELFGTPCFATYLNGRLFIPVQPLMQIIAESHKPSSITRKAVRALQASGAPTPPS